MTQKPTDKNLENLLRKLDKAIKGDVNDVEAIVTKTQALREAPAHIPRHHMQALINDPSERVRIAVAAHAGRFLTRDDIMLHLALDRSRPVQVTVGKMMRTKNYDTERVELDERLLLVAGLYGEFAPIRVEAIRVIIDELGPERIEKILSERDDDSTRAIIQYGSHLLSDDRIESLLNEQGGYGITTQASIVEFAHHRMDDERLKRLFDEADWNVQAEIIAVCPERLGKERFNRAVTDPNEDLRIAVIESPRARRLLSERQKWNLARDEHWRVRRAMAENLDKIHLPHDLVMRLMSDPHEPVRDAATEVRRTMVPEGDENLPTELENSKNLSSALSAAEEPEVSAEPEGPSLGTGT